MPTKSKSQTTIKNEMGFPTNRVSTHPGEILLEEFMKPFGLSANALALDLHVPSNRILAISKSERAVSADTALRLSRYFGTTAKFWTNLQNTYDLSKEYLERHRTIEREVVPHNADSEVVPHNADS